MGTHHVGFARLRLGHTTEDDLPRLARLTSLLHELGRLEDQPPLLVIGQLLRKGCILASRGNHLRLDHLKLAHGHRLTRLTHG